MTCKPTLASVNQCASMAVLLIRRCPKISAFVVFRERDVLRGLLDLQHGIVDNHTHLRANPILDADYARLLGIHQTKQRRLLLREALEVGLDAAFLDGGLPEANAILDGQFIPALLNREEFGAQPLAFLQSRRVALGAQADLLDAVAQHLVEA